MNEFNGDRIRELREKRNLTQKELAKAFGITEQAVSGWETVGVKRGSTLQQIASFFNVTVDYLKKNEENKGSGNSGNYNTSHSSPNVSPNFSIGANENSKGEESPGMFLYYKTMTDKLEKELEEKKEEIKNLNATIKELYAKLLNK